MANQVGAPDAVPDEYNAPLKKRGFHLERLLEKGAFGSVYSALQPSLARLGAVKFFDNRFMQNDQSRARFVREAQLLARIEHRATPYVLTNGTLEGDAARQTPYTVMQFVRGKHSSRSRRSTVDSSTGSGPSRSSVRSFPRSMQLIVPKLSTETQAG
jgi:serine/threonine protein kinase